MSEKSVEFIMDLTAVAAVAPVATVNQAASHLSGRQIVPGLAIVTVLLLTLVILFGPGGPLSGALRSVRQRIPRVVPRRDRADVKFAQAEHLRHQR